MRSPGPRRRTAPGGRPVGAPILAAGLAFGLLAGTASAAPGPSPGPSPGSAQEAADTAWTEPPGGSSPRAVVAPDSVRLDSMVAEVADRLRCPVCRNQSVLESTATLSRQMQSVIREKLAAGETPEEIEAYFVDKYGEWILLRPEAEGIGLLVYVLPAVALLGGGILMFWTIRRWSSVTPGGGSAGDRASSSGTGRDRTSEDGLEHLPAEEREWLRRELGTG